MADEERPRAVSGEIMTDPSRGSAGVLRDGDVIDAEYIVLPQEDRSCRSHCDESHLREPPSSLGAATSSPVGGMDMLRRVEAGPEPRKASRGGPLFWAAGVGLAVAAFWVSGGHSLVRSSPFIGDEASQSALRISAVKSHVDPSGARPVLFVDGEAANDGRATEHMPPLEIAVAGNDGRIMRYRLGTSGRPLAPGEIFAFSSRLDVPKNGVKTVSVTFAE